MNKNISLSSEYVRKGAVYLHIHPIREQHLLWIVQAALAAPSPFDWEFTGSNVKISCNGNHPSCIHRLGTCGQVITSKFHKHQQIGELTTDI